MRKRVGPIPASLLLAALVMVFGCGDSNIKKAKQFQNEKKYEQAVRYYRLALEKDPENQAARYGLIETYSQEVIDKGADQVPPEQVEKVMAELRPIAQPLMGDPNIKRHISMVYQMLAKRYAELGRDDKAAQAWTQVVEIEPTFAEAHFNLGLALSITGRQQDAISHFEKSISLNPYFVKGYHALGDTLFRLDRNEDAAQQYLKALELNPDDPAVHHNLGLTYFRSGNTEKAIAEYQKALEIEPNYSYAYRSLHEAYEKAGDKKKLKEIDAKWKAATEEYLQALHETHPLAAPADSEKAPAGTGS